MYRIFVVVFLTVMLAASPLHAGLLDKVKDYRDKKQEPNKEPDTNTITAGLKEALSIGAKNGVSNVSKNDGYFGNELIRIAMPEKLEKVENTLRKLGFHKEVDTFVLTMNRAAEKAAPKALSIFTDAIKAMTIADAVGILRGNDTAATDYLKSKTYNPISDAFKPIVSQAMNDVGVTHAFKQMMDKARSVPFLKNEAVDLDEYVTSKALDGLFVVVGQEEKKIRKDPVARVTDLLKQVFK